MYDFESLEPCLELTELPDMIIIITLFKISNEIETNPYRQNCDKIIGGASVLSVNIVADSI